MWIHIKLNWFNKFFSEYHIGKYAVLKRMIIHIKIYCDVCQIV